MGRVITFYSYKGGTGRSMVLANVAWILASAGKRVLTIDWDLEAPGLHRYFHPFLTDKELDGQESQGVIDMVMDFAERAATPTLEHEPFDDNWYARHGDFSKWRQRLRWPSGDTLRLGRDGRGAIEFVPAGRQGPDYARRVNHFDWRAFYEKHGGGAFFDAAKKNFFDAVDKSFDPYDYVLIDSRTGVSDTSGICTVHLPDMLVVCFTLNHQSTKGALAVAQSVRKQRPDMPIFPLPTRIDSGEQQLLTRAKNHAVRLFGPLLDPGIDADEYWYSMEVPYFPRYAYFEKLALFEEQSSITSSILPAMQRLCGYLTDRDVETAGPLPEKERARAMAEFEGIEEQPVLQAAAAKDRIFISYRRDDARGASGRLYDWLRIAFGRERVIRDVDRTGVGNWRKKIDDALARSAVCVAVIGPRWTEAENLVRLADEGDMVRYELLTALNSAGLTMLPTLVEGARVPDPTILPPELHPLFDGNARPITPDGWEEGTRRLIRDIATSLPIGPDLKSLLSNVGAAQHIGEREQARDLQAGQIEAVQGTISELTSKLAESPSEERSNLTAAFAALAQGDTRAAEGEFEREYENQHRAEQASPRKLPETRRRMADAARNVANLALLRDTAKAVRFYRRALDLAGDTETARLLGNALLPFGALQEARKVLLQSLELAMAQGNSWGEMAAQGDLGRVARLMGNLQEANTAFSRSVEVAERQLSVDPDNAVWQRNLLVSHNRIGDILWGLGDKAGALAAYAKSLAIAEAFAARDPANAEWQRDLMLNNDKIGDALLEQDDAPRALAAYAKSLAIAESLAARYPANAEWQRDLAVSRGKIGDVLAAQGDGPGALTAYAKGLAIREALAARDPTNAEWQRDLVLDHNKVGGVLVAQGDGPGALAAYVKGLAIAEALATRDPANTEWQRDLSISHERIGDILVRQDDEPGALGAYARSLAIREALAARDPTNSEWLRDLSIGYKKTGDVLVAQGDNPGAMAAYAKGLVIAKALAARDPANTEWQRDLSASHDRIGFVLVAQGDVSGALAAYAEELATTEALAARDPTNTEWQRDLAFSYKKIGDVRMAQGDDPGALAESRKALVITEALAARDPANAEWQRDLAVSHDRIGDLLRKEDDEPGALAAYARGLAIAESLAARDPANAEWLRELAVSHNRIANLLMKQGDEAGALAAYTRSLAIHEALAARDPANAEWQRDLSISHDRIGSLLLRLGDKSGALAAYAKGLAIREALTTLDPTNVEWQRDLSTSHGRIGDILGDLGDEVGALAAYRKNLAFAEALAAREPANTQWQHDLAASQDRVGDVLAAQGDGPAALAAYRKSLAIVEALAARDPANAQWQTDLAITYSKLAVIQQGQSTQLRLDYLRRGSDILRALSESGRLRPSLQPVVDFFEKQLALPKAFE